MKPLMCNVGTTDKTIRIVLGAIVFVILFALKTWWWFAGVALIVSGLLELCPLYLLFGINTCKVPQKWWK